MIFKALNGLTPKYISDLLIRNSENHLRVLRNTTTDLQLPKKAAKNGEKCFSFCGPKSWNALKPDIKMASSLKIFKERLLKDN